jgi:hypothetical protein
MSELSSERVERPILIIWRDKTGLIWEKSWRGKVDAEKRIAKQVEALFRTWLKEDKVKEEL